MALAHNGVRPCVKSIYHGFDMYSFETKIMRGVVFLRLLVLLSIISIITGITMVDLNDELPPTNDVPEEDEMGEFAEADASAPLEADYNDEESAEPEDSGGGGSPFVFIGAGGGVLSSIIFGSMFFEFIRVLFFLAFLTPLVARKQHNKERTRGRILGFIEGNAGVHFSAIRDGLGLANGVTAYHLQILEREDSIISWRDRKLRRYAVSTINPKDIASIRNPLYGTRLVILEVLSQSGTVGLNGKQIRMRLEISRQLLSHHLRVLSNDGFVVKRGSTNKAPWTLSLLGTERLQLLRNDT